MSALPMPQLPDGSVRELFEQLHRLHHRAGWPSLREMARQVGCSHTTVSAAFSEPRLPRWGLLELIVESLGGDPDQFHELWLAASAGQQHAAPREAEPRQTGAAKDRAEPVPRQLPADVAGFTGREQQLEALDRLLRHAGRPDPGAVFIMTICGTAGVGKTALAVHWAHRVAGRYPDGQLYADLRGYDPAQPVATTDVLAGFLRALGVEGPAIPPEQADRAARLRTLLAGRRMLLLLDNAGSVSQIRDLLPGTSGCFVLVTSRDALPGLVARHGAHRLNLDQLSAAEARTLLRRLIGARVDAEPEAAATLARQCARLPLALRIAAELAVALPRRALAELVAELADARRRLDQLSAGEDDYAAVRAAFSWSLRHLPEQAARAFGLLGVHRGPDIDPAAVAALLGVDPQPAHRALHTLVRAHLVEEADDGRLRMHDLLRAYAEELAAAYPDDDRHAALTRLLDHYLAAASAAVRAGTPPADAGTSPGHGFADAAQARAWLDTERVNLVAAAVAGEAAAPRSAIRLAVTLGRYLDATAHYSDGVTLGLLAVRAAAATGDAAEGACLVLLANAYRRLSRYRDAAQRYEQALAQARDRGDAAVTGDALRGLGAVHWRLGHYPEAIELLTEAADTHRRVGDRSGEASALNNLGIACRRLGRYPQAVEHYERALALARELHDGTAETGTMNNLGIVYLRLGRHNDAIDLYQRALAGYRATGDRIGESIALNNLGEAHEREGRYPQAADQHRAALDICQALGHRVGVGIARHGLGCAYAGMGRYPEAADQLREAASIAADLSEADLRTRALIDLAAVLRARGEPGPAASTCRSALELAERTANRYEQARAHAVLALLARDTGDGEVAAEHWRTALRRYADLGVPEADEVRRQLAAPSPSNAG